MRNIPVVLCSVAFVAATGAAVAAQALKTQKVPAMEQLTCRTGPNDKQARLVVAVVKGRPMEFAYYSRLGTNVCSIHGRRGDFYTKWEDQDGKAMVKLRAGNAELEYRPGYAKLTFLEVDRMPYCGSVGELNGVVEVASKKSDCELGGVFD
jgi:hypothetical protein